MNKRTKDLPNLPSLKQRRKEWKSYMKLAWFRYAVFVLTLPLLSYFFAAIMGQVFVPSTPAWLPLAIATFFAIVTLTVAATQVMKSYPKKWHVEFDQRIRRYQKANDRVQAD